MTANQLSFQVYESIAGPLLADWSGRVEGLKIRTNLHGFETCYGFIPLDVDDAFYFYEILINTHVLVTGSGETAWEGRIEDVTLQSDGIEFQAFGYWRALSDFPYTALWSTQRFDKWRIGTLNFAAGWRNDRWELDNQDRLHWSLRNGELYGNNSTYGVWFYEAPHNATIDIKQVDFTYDIDLPTDWKLELISAEEG